MHCILKMIVYVIMDVIISDKRYFAVRIRAFVIRMRVSATLIPPKSSTHLSIRDYSLKNIIIQQIHCTSQKHKNPHTQTRDLISNSIVDFFLWWQLSCCHQKHTRIDVRITGEDYFWVMKAARDWVSPSLVIFLLLPYLGHPVWCVRSA